MNGIYPLVISFLKLENPQIIHFNGIFPYKSSSYWGTPPFMESYI